MDKITDYVSRAVAALISQDRAGASMPAVVGTLAAELQTAEDELVDLVAQRMLATSVGIHLDRYGALVGVSRNGLDDVRFARVLTAGRIAANLSCGNPESITAILSALSLSDVEYAWNGIAAYSLSWVDRDLIPGCIQVETAQSIQVYTTFSSVSVFFEVAAGAYTPQELVDYLNVGTRMPSVGVTVDLYEGKFRYTSSVGRRVIRFAAALELGTAMGGTGLIDANPVDSMAGEPVLSVNAAWLAAVTKLLDDVRPAGVEHQLIVGMEDGFTFDDDDLGFDNGSLWGVL